MLQKHVCGIGCSEKKKKEIYNSIISNNKDIYQYYKSASFSLTSLLNNWPYEHMHSVMCNFKAGFFGKLDVICNLLNPIIPDVRFTHITLKPELLEAFRKVYVHGDRIGIWNTGFWGGCKIGGPRKNTWKQGQEPVTNSTNAKREV